MAGVLWLVYNMVYGAECMVVGVWWWVYDGWCIVVGV